MIEVFEFWPEPLGFTLPQIDEPVDAMLATHCEAQHPAVAFMECETWADE